MICPKDETYCDCDRVNWPRCPPKVIDPRLSITADEFAAMVKDAERYRWLLKQFGTLKIEHFIISGTFDLDLTRLVDKYAAIDAAMESNQGEVK